MSSKAHMLLITLLLLIASLVGCSRSEDAPPGEAVPSADLEEAESSMALTEEGRARAQSEVNDEDEAANQPEIDPRENAFAARRRQSLPIDPIDFAVGKIGPPPSGSAAAAWRAANELLISAVFTDGARLPSALSSTDRRAYAELREQGPFDEVRLARPVLLSDQSYSLEFRLFGRDNDIIGEIVIDAQNGEWYSSGIQTMPSTLVRKRYAPHADVPGLVW
ncbi:MAG: hypothetical protein ACLFP4_01310 [Spirochaetales bacterium]